MSEPATPLPIFTEKSVSKWSAVRQVKARRRFITVLVPPSTDLEEYRALRAEILLRVTLQNITLLGLVPGFVAAIALMIVQPAVAQTIVLVYVVACGMSGLLWSHHAARTTQIKYYLRLVIEPRLRSGGGWERWHAVNRVTGRLGSRWRISTIGVFLGSDIAALGFGVLLGPAAPSVPMMLVAAASILGTAILLLPPRMAPELQQRFTADD